MKIKVLGKSEFSIIIDNKSRFFITKHTISTDERIVVIQEKIKTKSFINSIRGFFQAISNLFYRPTYPSKDLKQRSYREAVQQDYRALRKSLKNGRTWLQSKRDIKIKSQQKSERVTLHQEVDDVIKNAKQIEDAIRKKDQIKALEKLADTFSARIFYQIEPGQSVVIPVGYLNRDKTLQPVMLRFEKNDANEILLQIYADAAEGRGKIWPLHQRLFNENVKKTDIETVLTEAFKPLIISNTHEKSLKKAAKPSDFFSAISTPSIKEGLESARKGKEITKKTSHKKTQAFYREERTASLTFDAFLRVIDDKMSNYWTIKDVSNQKLKKQPGSPSERVVSWFNQLIDDDTHKLSKNEKLNLMYFLTKDYTQDLLQQLERKPPRFKKPSLEKQLAVYKNVAGHIEYMREKIAVSLNDGHPLNTRGIPLSLKETETLCAKKINTIKQKLLERKRAGKSRELRKVQSAALGFNVGPLIATRSVISHATAIIEEQAPVESLDEIAWQEKWQQDSQTLSALSSAESVVHQQRRQIVQEFNHVQERGIQHLKDRQLYTTHLLTKAADYRTLDNTKKIALIDNILQLPIPIRLEDKNALLEAKKNPDTLNVTTIQDIITNGNGRLATLVQKIEAVDVQNLVTDRQVNEEGLKQIIDAIVGGMDSSGLHAIQDKLNVDPQQLASIIRQLIVSPLLFPSFLPSEQPIKADQVITTLKEISDPQLASGSPFYSISKDLRALLSMRMLLPKNLMKNQIQALWKEQLDMQKTAAAQHIDRVLDTLIEEWTEKIKKTEDQQILFEAEKRCEIFRAIRAKDSFSGKIKEFDDQCSKLEEGSKILNELTVKSGPYWKRQQPLLHAIEKERQLAGFFDETLNNIPEVFLSSSEKRLELGSLEKQKTEEGLKSYCRDFTDRVRTLTQSLQEFSLAAAKEPNPTAKKTMYEEIKTRSVQLLSMLPAPGTDSVHGTPSLWRALNQVERKKIRQSLSELEHHVWEAHMRLSKTELTGKEKFLMIKSQAINMALIREEIRDQKEMIEHLLTKTYREEANKLTTILKHEGIEVKKEEARVIINLETMQTSPTSKAIQELASFVTDCSQQDHSLIDINPMFLTLDEITLNTLEINKVLTQDVTSCLSQDPILENEIQAVYHYIIADQNRGKSDKILKLQRRKGPAKEGRSPLLLPEWKRFKIGDAHNPYLLDYLPQHFFRTCPTNNVGKELLLAINSHLKSSESHDTERYNEQLKTVLLHNNRESFNSKSNAIIWNAENQELQINWESQDLEWDQLWEILLTDNPEIMMRKALADVIDQNIRGEIYYATAADPDYTLYQITPPKAYADPTGLSFFEKTPSYFLNQQTPLDITPPLIQEADIEINAGGSEPLAEVHIYGKRGEADWSSLGLDRDVSEDKVHLLMKPKLPFLPTVNQKKTKAVSDHVFIGSNDTFEDIRHLRSYDVWKEYIMELAGDEILSIPPAVLLELYKIRQAPDDNKNGKVVTSYTSDTALNALDFMTNNEYQTYMQNDFVQNYLLESIFGPMVLQQAIIDHPEHLSVNIGQIKQVLRQAKRSRNHALVGFYSFILDKLETHVTHAREELKEQGLFSGTLTSLPVFRGKKLGVLETNVNKGMLALDGDAIRSVTEAKFARKASIIQPLVSKLEHLKLCAEMIEDAKKEDPQLPNTVKDILMDSQDGKYPIDSITNPEARRQAFTHLLHDYRSIGIANLHQKDWIELFMGYETLSKSGREGGLPTLEKEIVNWIQQDVLPFFQTKDQNLQDMILKAIVNQKLKDEGKKPIDESIAGTFAPIEKKAHKFQLATGFKIITLDLNNMEITGIDLTKKSRLPVPIPEEIMKRSDVRQALHISAIQATKSEKGKTATYSWSHEGQDFSLTVEDDIVSITRKISSHPNLNDGMYRFVSINLTNPVNHGENLLGNHGVWVHQDTQQAYILDSGMNLPTSETLYEAHMENDGTISRLETVKGRLVSTSMRMDGPAPTLFANAQNTIIHIDAKTGLPAELCLPELGISLEIKDNVWECSQRGQVMGSLKVPNASEEKTLRETFGDHWDQFVIPLERSIDKDHFVKGEKVRVHDKETIYLMIPYLQRVDKNGSISVDQAFTGEIPHIQTVLMNSDGVIRGSMASDLYLSHRYLLQAEKTKNPAISRKLFMKALMHLEKIQSQPPPSSPEEVENLRYVINAVASNPAISLKPTPSPAGISLALKMSLFVQQIRKKSEDQNIKVLQVDGKQELEELTAIAKIYQAHQMLPSSKQAKLHKQLFELTVDEEKNLENINKKMLQRLEKDISLPPGRYFGATGRLASTIMLERPETIDPNFLLTLVRISKSCNEQKSLAGVTSPLPLGDLLENFWSYFISIKNEGIPPEKLLFLFDESIIPPTDSLEQEEQLRALDLQARQFLLSMADLMKQTGGKVDPMKDAQKGIEEIQKTIEDIQKEDSQARKTLKLFEGKPNIKSNFDLVCENVQKLNVDPLPDTDPPLPDLIKLSRKVREIKTHIENFKESMEEASKEGKDLIKRASAHHHKLFLDLREAEKTLKNAMLDNQEQQPSAKEIDSIDKLKQKVEEAKQKYENDKHDFFVDPFSGSQLMKSMIIDGTYEKISGLKQQEQLIKQTDHLLKELDKQLKYMKESSTKLEQWATLQEYIHDIETVPFKMSGRFSLPESGAGRAFIEKILLESESTKSPSLLKAGLSLVRQLGPKTSVRLGMSASSHPRLKNQLKTIDAELAKQTGNGRNEITEKERREFLAQKTELKKKLLSNPMGFLEAAGKALGPLIIAGEATGKPIVCKPSDVAKQTPSTTPLSIENLEHRDFVRECFTNDQIARINSNLSNLNEEEQKTYVQQLETALEMRASLIKVRIGLQDNISAINQSYASRISREIPESATILAHSFEKISNKTLLEKYENFFSAHTEFVDTDVLKINADTLEFLKNQISVLISDEQNKQRILTEIRTRLESVQDTFEPYLEALALIANKVPSSSLEQFALNIKKASTSEELLQHIRKTYKEQAPLVADTEHKAFVSVLQEKILPEDSLYAEDLKKGFEKIARENPLAYSTVIKKDWVEHLEKELAYDVAKLRAEVKNEKDEIIRRLEAIKLSNLPKSLQKMRIRKGSRTELLDAASNEYRKGSFDAASFITGTIKKKAYEDLSLDQLIGKCLIDDTRRQVLQGARFNASNSVQQLYRLREKKALVKEKIVKSAEHVDVLKARKAELISKCEAIGDWMPDMEDTPHHLKIIVEAVLKKTVITDKTARFEEGKVYDVNNQYIYVESVTSPNVDGMSFFEEKANIKSITDNILEERKQYKITLDSTIARLTTEIDTYTDQLNDRLGALDSMWLRESNKVRDYTGRCQDTTHMENLPDKLKSYVRHINYLQQRLGLVLRNDQIETLNEIIENPSLLKQLRMGLGKTSIIIPFALTILSAKGYNTLGMVPKALFNTNFNEMDETTRAVFELAGNQFTFSRQDLTFPLDTVTLYNLSNKCADLFNALNRGEYILTTIESKASLDNKINEIEHAQSEIQSLIDEIKNENAPGKDEQIAKFYKKLVNHQMTLDMLYKIKSIFEAENTRLIIDEVDTVARANYSVNSESGVKTPISPQIQRVAIDLFDVMTNNPELASVFEQIQQNNQLTLDENEVNAAIKSMGAALIQEHQQLKEKEKDILDWFAGTAICPYNPVELQQLGPIANRLKIIRKALNSALRSSMRLKVGLSCDFDPTHEALGIPASQGVTSKTTKYSDPLMQVILTQMIALYKPQGEAFLKTSAVDVIIDMKKELKFLESSHVDSTKKRLLLEEGIDELRKLIDPEKLKSEQEKRLSECEDEELKNYLENEIKIINNHIASPRSYQEALKNNTPLNIFLRLRFAQQVAKRGLIYVSGSEISRPVQHALRGCHVIGLTGTATRNTEHVITGRGYQKGMESVSKTGRESTAEVIYRFVKALSKGSHSAEEALQTSVQTYSLDPNETFQQFVDLSRAGSGYRFLINQAGACDHLSLRQITAYLNKESQRPIIYLDMDEEGRSEKVALINGERRPLNRLSEQEKQNIEENGFFYYHTPHVRGTHFDIPPGSKGALFLSPTVNANDRDQAIYRARAIGEGHTVEPFISEKQRDEFLEAENKKTITLGDILKIQHEQTRDDESKEDLSAYTLHLKGIVNLAADKAKEKIQLEHKTIRSIGGWMKTDKQEDYLEEIEAKVRAFEILENLFIKDSGNDAYIRQLDKETRQGGTMLTDRYLAEVVIKGEQSRIKRYLDEIQKIKEDSNPQLNKALETIESELNNADISLQKETDKIHTEWAFLSKQLPLVTASTPATQETSETEAEAESVAETTAETAAETARKKRKKRTRNLLTVPNYDLLYSFRENPETMTKNADIEFLSSSKFLSKENLPPFSNIKLFKILNGKAFISRRLLHMISDAGLGQLPALKAIIVKNGVENLVVLTDPADANHLTGHFSYFSQYLKNEDSVLTTGYSIKPSVNGEGEIELVYGETGSLGISQLNQFDDDHLLKGQLYTALIRLGASMISSSGWSDIEHYWNSLEETDKQSLKKSLEKQLTTVNPPLLKKAALYMWNKEIKASS